jgi:SAM-dependent methyltransferase
MAAPWIPAGARVLDVGCADGALFALLGDRVSGGIGIDPEGADARPREGVRLIRGAFPQDAPLERFDVVTMLAVLEHFPSEALDGVARGVAAALRDGGRLILTVPEPAVDRIVDTLRRVHVLDGMELDEHHGFATAGTRSIFEPHRLRLVAHRRFQLGLNNLYVFERFDGTARAS